MQIDDLAMLGNSHWDAIAFTASLCMDACACLTELRVVSAVLRWMQAQVLIDNTPPVWLCTMATQPVSYSGMHRHAGLWGMARACRQERAAMPVCCVDVGDGARGMATVIRQQILRLPSGQVRGLHLSPSTEPEAAFCAVFLHVPRLVAPYDVQDTFFEVPFTAVCSLLDAHTVSAMADLDREQLLQAYAFLETLCQQYLQQVAHSLPNSKVSMMWHHKLLYAWCTKQYPPSDCAVVPGDVHAANPCLWPEVRLAERCGTRFADALLGVCAYQEILFPGGALLSLASA
ncbi:hypothetical protein OAO87_01730 [bacterium]|nr:hypothetical protein [bacterium]